MYPSSSSERDAASRGHTSGIPASGCLIPEADAGSTARAFMLPGRLRHPPVTSRPSFGQITHVFRARSAGGVSPKRLRTQRLVPPRGTGVPYLSVTTGMSWRHRGFTWKPQSSLTKRKRQWILASGICIPESLPVHTGINQNQNQNQNQLYSPSVCKHTRNLFWFLRSSWYIHAYIHTYKHTYIHINKHIWHENRTFK